MKLKRLILPLVVCITSLSCATRPPAGRSPSPPPLPSYSGPCELPPEPEESQYLNGTMIEAVYVESPAYPQLAQQAGIEGTTFVRVLVDCWGKVVQTRLAKSSGTQSLDDAALEAAGKCRFRPPEDRNGPKAAWTTIRYEFNLP